MKKRWLVCALLLLLSVGLFGRAGSGGRRQRPNPCLSSLPSWCGERGTTAPPVSPARRAMAMRWKSPTPMQPKSLAGWMSMRKGVFQTTRVSRMEVAPGNPAGERLSVPNPGGNTWYLHFTAADGGLIQGDLTAVQRNP